MRTKRLLEMEEHFRLNDTLSEDDTLKVFQALLGAEYITPPQAAMSILIKGNYSTDREASKQINELLDKYSKLSKSHKKAVKEYRALIGEQEGETDEE